MTQGGDDNTPNYTDCAEEATARPGDRVWFYHQLTQARRTGGTVEYTNQTGSPAARPILFSSRLSFAVQLGQVLGETLADEVLDACEATNMNWPTGVAEGIKLTDRSPVYTSINATGSLGEGANALPLCQFVVPELNQSLRLESLLDFGPEEDFEVTRAIVNLAP